MPISPGTHLVYTIQPGDTLYTIANRLGTSVPALVQANALYPPVTDPDRIYPGQVLLARLPGISQQSAVQHQAAPGDTLYRIAERYSAGVDMLAALNQMERPDILPVARLVWVPAFVYEVVPGDSLFRISRRFGIPMSELTRANRGRPGFSLDVIYPGFYLVAPLPSSANIVVFQPLPGSKIVSGSPLSGAARAFEAVVDYQVRDTSGRIITAEKAVTASEGAPAFGRFETTIALDQSPPTTTGMLMVYTRSARDGSIQDLVEVPVTF